MANQAPVDAQGKRSIVVEALAPPYYKLERMDARALQKFEDQYNVYSLSLAEEGQISTARTKVQCFNANLFGKDILSSRHVSHLQKKMPENQYRETQFAA